VRLIRWLSQAPELALLAIIVLAGCALRLSAIALLNHVPQSDETAYLSMAQNLLRGRGVLDFMGNYAMYNAGYPILVLAPLFQVFGENLLFARLANTLLGLAAIVLVWAVAAQAGASRFGRLCAAAIWALYLPASVYGVYLFKEHLMIPLMLGTVWCSLRLMQRPTFAVAAGCGALYGVLAVTGNASLSLLAATVAALLLADSSKLVGKRHHIALVGVVAGTCLLVASPWMARNAMVLGAPVLNTNGGFNLYLGNNPAATGNFISISETPRGPTWEALRKTGEVQASKVLRDDAVAWILSNPRQFAELALRKAVYFWSLPAQQGKGEPSRIERWLRFIWLLQYLLIAGAALSAWLFAAKRNRQVALLWLCVGVYTAVHMIFYAGSRYREPAMPLLGILAALGVESAIDWLRTRSGSGASVA